MSAAPEDDGTGAVTVHLHHPTVPSKDVVRTYDRVSVDEPGGWLRCERGDDRNYAVDLYPPEEIRRVEFRPNGGDDA